MASKFISPTSAHLGLVLWPSASQREVVDYFLRKRFNMFRHPLDMGIENKSGLCKSTKTSNSWREHKVILRWPQCGHSMPEVVVEWKEFKVVLSIPGTSLAIEDILFTASVCNRDAVKISLTKAKTVPWRRALWHLNQHACYLESLGHIASKNKTRPRPRKTI